MILFYGNSHISGRCVYRLLFSGKPTPVCLLELWPSDDILQNIAAGNNLSETDSFLKKGTLIEIRWFTPVVEGELCGHATLVAAHVLFNHLSF